jgi:hypothetical protein
MKVNKTRVANKDKGTNRRRLQAIQLEKKIAKTKIVIEDDAYGHECKKTK